MTVPPASPAFDIMPAPGHPSIRALLAYWTRKRRDRPFPLRGDIDPIELKDHLASLFMLDVIDGGRDYRYRLVGTALVGINARDATGFAFSTLYAGQPGALAAADRLLLPVVRERRPLFARGRMFWRPDRDYRRFEAGYFPVSGDGVAVDILLCEIRFS